MAAIKVTFSLPEPLAKRFLRQVPSRDRSRYLAQVLERNFRESDEALVRSCWLANEDPEVKQIEQEFDQLQDPLPAPWNDSPKR